MATCESPADSSLRCPFAAGPRHDGRAGRTRFVRARPLFSPVASLRDVRRRGYNPWMSDAPVDPGPVFRTTLAAGTSLLVAFVPSRDRVGAPIDQDYWVDELLTTLGQTFRGATAYPCDRGV